MVELVELISQWLKVLPRLRTKGSWIRINEEGVPMEWEGTKLGWGLSKGRAQGKPRNNK